MMERDALGIQIRRAPDNRDAAAALRTPRSRRSMNATTAAGGGGARRRVEHRSPSEHHRGQRAIADNTITSRGSGAAGSTSTLFSMAQSAI